MNIEKFSSYREEEKKSLEGISKIIEETQESENKLKEEIGKGVINSLLSNEGLRILKGDNLSYIKKLTPDDFKPTFNSEADKIEVGDIIKVHKSNDKFVILKNDIQVGVLEGGLPQKYLKGVTIETIEEEEEEEEIQEVALPKNQEEGDNLLGKVIFRNENKEKDYGLIKADIESTLRSLSNINKNLAKEKRKQYKALSKDQLENFLVNLRMLLNAEIFKAEQGPSYINETEVSIARETVKTFEYKEKDKETIFNDLLIEIAYNIDNLEDEFNDSASYIGFKDEIEKEEILLRKMGADKSVEKTLYFIEQNPEFANNEKLTTYFKKYENMTLGLEDKFEDATSIFENKELGEKILLTRMRNAANPKEVFTMIKDFHRGLDKNWFISDKAEKYYVSLNKKLIAEAINNLNQISDNKLAAEKLFQLSQIVTETDGKIFGDIDDKFIDVRAGGQALSLAMQRYSKNNPRGTMMERIADRNGIEDELLEGKNISKEVNAFTSVIDTLENKERIYQVFGLTDASFVNKKLSQLTAKEKLTLGMIVRVNRDNSLGTADFAGALKKAIITARNEVIDNIDLTGTFGGVIDGDDYVDDGTLDNFEGKMIDQYNEMMGTGWFDIAEDNNDDIIEGLAMVGAAIGTVVASPFIVAGLGITGGIGIAATALTSATMLTTATTLIEGEGFDSWGDFGMKKGLESGANLLTFGGAGAAGKIASNVGSKAVLGTTMTLGMGGEALRQSVYYENGSFYENLAAQGLVGVSLYLATKGAVKFKALGKSDLEIKNISTKDLIKKGLEKTRLVDSPDYVPGVALAEKVDNGVKLKLNGTEKNSVKEVVIEGADFKNDKILLDQKILDGGKLEGTVKNAKEKIIDKIVVDLKNTEIKYNEKTGIFDIIDTKSNKVVGFVENGILSTTLKTKPLRTTVNETVSNTVNKVKKMPENISESYKNRKINKTPNKKLEKLKDKYEKVKTKIAKEETIITNSDKSHSIVVKDYDEITKKGNIAFNKEDKTFDLIDKNGNVKGTINKNGELIKKEFRKTLVEVGQKMDKFAKYFEAMDETQYTEFLNRLGKKINSNNKYVNTLKQIGYRGFYRTFLYPLRSLNKLIVNPSAKGLQELENSSYYKAGLNAIKNSGKGGFDLLNIVNKHSDSKLGKAWITAINTFIIGGVVTTGKMLDNDSIENDINNAADNGVLGLAAYGVEDVLELAFLGIAYDILWEIYESGE